MNEEIIKKVRAAKSPEEIIGIAKSEGANMKAEVAEDIFNSVGMSGELSDEEINVSAGGCGSKPAQPGINVLDEQYLAVVCPECGYSSNLAGFIDRGSGEYKGKKTRYVLCPSCHYVSNIYDQLERRKNLLQ